MKQRVTSCWQAPCIPYGVSRPFLTVVVALMAVIPASAQAQLGAIRDLPTFRAAVDLVSVAAVVRDKRGQVVRNLKRDDFQVIDAGVSRRIVEFTANEAGSVSLALLVDVSGSMRTAANLASAQRVADHLLAWLDASADEVALFTFDRDLYENQAFTSDASKVRDAMAGLEAFGMTSLYDAIEGTARKLAERPSKRRAIIILTDGEDNASRLTAKQISSAIVAADMPVYVVAVVSPVDKPGVVTDAGLGGTFAPTGPLGNLSWWTGGTMFFVTNDAEASVAARTLLAELRHQYFLAFEGATTPGWRPLDIRLKRSDLTVRARSGYYAAMPRRAGN